MDAVQVAVAKAVTAKIEASNLNPDITLERSYADWDLKLDITDLPEMRDIDKLRIDVVAHTSEQKQDASARGKAKFIVPISIAIRRKFGQDKLQEGTGRIQIGEIDALVLLVQQCFLMFTFASLDLDDYDGAVWDKESGGTSIITVSDPKPLRQLHQFLSIIRVYFRVDVSLNV